MFTDLKIPRDYETTKEEYTLFTFICCEKMVQKSIAKYKSKAYTKGINMFCLCFQENWPVHGTQQAWQCNSVYKIDTQE